MPCMSNWWANGCPAEHSKLTAKSTIRFLSPFSSKHASLPGPLSLCANTYVAFEGNCGAKGELHLCCCSAPPAGRFQRMFWRQAVDLITDAFVIRLVFLVWLLLCDSWDLSNTFCFVFQTFSWCICGAVMQSVIIWDFFMNFIQQFCMWGKNNRWVNIWVQFGDALWLQLGLICHFTLHTKVWRWLNFEQENDAAELERT